MPATQPRSSSTQVRVLLDHVGRGKLTRSVRRPFLFDQETGRILELQTAYLDHQFGLDSLNTQLAVLADLRFFQAWVTLKLTRNAEWISPQYRAAANQVPLTEREVKDFGRWCQRKAGSLEKETESGHANVTQLPGADVVGAMFRNRRLRNASQFLQWLVVSLADSDDSDENEVSRTEVRRRFIERWFNKQLLPDSKSFPPGSLDPLESVALQAVLHDQNFFPNTQVGMRDQLIFKLLDQGVRAGELLKLQVGDVNSSYRLTQDRCIGIISIARRPNDADDERVREPSVKTRPGILPIPKRLAQALITFITEIRRPAINARADGKETPYLFVNLTGRHTGLPMSQRNLNRIVSKLKGRCGLPDSLKPHTLRHTHFTELYDNLRQKGRHDQEIRESLVERGRWAPNSSMPARYVVRSLMRESAEYVEERDSRLQNG